MILVSITVVALVLPGVLAAGAGRAFPIDSENYVIEQFQLKNPDIAWDPTNYLIDLSGHYANCKYVGIKGALNDITEKTPDGLSIGVVVDFVKGSRKDTDGVNGYLTELIDDWMSTGLFDEEIRESERFGCSVRPGCKKNAAVACLFGRKGSGQIQEFKAPPTARVTQRPRPPLKGKQEALAFTKEQYDMAERIIGKKWDRSHYLENLSGYEGRCAMIDTPRWDFDFATEEAGRENMIVTGVFGHAENKGSTPKALEIILSGLPRIPDSSEIGCCVIPDCVTGNKMYVVVTCIYDNV